MLSAQENQLLTRTGPGTAMGELMRRYWIPALFSRQLPEPDGPPIRVRLLGEDLVAFRDGAGRIGLFDEHCPHRGASLFFGRNEECGLRCVYHGWKFDVEGNCVDMPNEPPESNFKHKIKHTAYPCGERGGVVWTYMGPADLQPALPEFEWAMVPEAHRFATRHLQDCNWLQAMEGGIDTAHVPFLHLGGHLAGKNGSAPPGAQPILKFEVVPTEYGFAQGNGRDLPDRQVHWTVVQCLMPWYKLIPPVRGNPLIGAHAWVPVDDEQCMTWTIEYHPDRPLTEEELAGARSWQSIHLENLPGSDRTVLNRENDYRIDRELQRSGKSYTGIYGTGAQDSAIQESMGPVYDRTREHLGVSDIPVIELRRCLLGALKGLAAGAAPPGLSPASHGVRSSYVDLPAGVPFREVAPRSR